MLHRWLGISLWLVCQSHLALADERFDEDLHIRPLQDGRLYTRFSFTTLLKDAVPRSPVMLTVADTRELHGGMLCALLLMLAIFYSSALHRIPVGSWPDNP
jgi:GPI-anchor transamidase subunit T